MGFDPDDAGKRADELLEKIYADTKDDDSARANDDEDIEDNDTDNESDGGGEDWEAKFKTLQGKYNAEIPRLTEELKAVHAEKARLEAAKAPKGLQDAISDKVSEIEERITMMQKEYPVVFDGIDALVKKRVSETIRPTEEKVNNLASHAQTTDQARFEEMLDKEVPEWRKINNDPKFKKWLGETDRYTGASKLDLLRGAFYNRNLNSTKAFFDDFTGNASGMRMERHERRSEDTFDDIAPPTSGGAPVTGKPKGRYVTREEINQFYKDRAAGTWRGTEEEAKKMEANFFNAVKENRIR